MKKHKNLNLAIENCFGPFIPENVKQTLFEAAEKDYYIESYCEDSDKSWVIDKFNEIFNKKSRIMSQSVSKKYKTIFKHFDRYEIEAAMRTASLDQFHKQNYYKYCTLEYFSRVDQMDKWLTAATSEKWMKEREEKKSSFVLPVFNLKG
jgi:predicted DNA binding protein